MACGALLAMPTVSVNGVDMTANVITEPERFHILSGRTCQAADEVVLTEFAAADLGVAVGDTVTLAGAFRQWGIYRLRHLPVRQTTWARTSGCPGRATFPWGRIRPRCGVPTTFWKPPLSSPR